MEKIIETGIDMRLYSWTTEQHMYATLSRDQNILITHVYKSEEDLIKDIPNIKRYIKRLNCSSTALYEIEFKLSYFNFLNGIEERLIILFEYGKGVSCYYSINKEQIKKIELISNLPLQK